MLGLITRVSYLCLGLLLGVLLANKNASRALFRLTTSCSRLAVNSFYSGCEEGRNTLSGSNPPSCEIVTKAWYESMKPLLSPTK